ncbi:MAG: N-acetylmuramoyl-L-alanine amidase [Candidatus Aenigmarchaeota archaeon]|nr:N-acetylmuramoyl-L-alanine amidase [Candidatus Aenigmarchaeota archaeon]
MNEKIIIAMTLISGMFIILFSARAEIYPSEIGKMLSDFENERNVIINFGGASDDFPDEAEFNNAGRELYLINEMDKKGLPDFNVFVLYAKINGQPTIGYFHSYNCDIFTRVIKGLKEELDTEPSEKDFKDILENLINRTEYVLDIGGEECLLNVCELIKNGEDERYEGFNCEKKGANGKDDKDPHKCVKGAEEILCLYAEAYKTGETETFIDYGKTVFLVDDSDWRTTLSLLPIAVYHTYGNLIEIADDGMKNNARLASIIYNPWIVYHKEGNSVDIESVMHLLKQLKYSERTNPEEIIIIADSEKIISKNLLLALSDKNVGLGFEPGKIKFVKPEDYNILWAETISGIGGFLGQKEKKYDSVVVSDANDYEAGLMAAHFASFMHMPLIFVDPGKDGYEKELGRYKDTETVYIVGDFDDNFKLLIRGTDILKMERRAVQDSVISYSKEGLVNYISETLNANKMILVNPADIETENCENFDFTTSFGTVTNEYCGDSINAPLLATFRNEIITFTNTEPVGYDISLPKCEHSDLSSSPTQFMDSEGKIYSYQNDKISFFDTKNFDKWQTIISGNYFVSFSVSPDKKTIFGVEKKTGEMNKYSFYPLSDIISRVVGIKPEFTIENEKAIFSYLSFSGTGKPGFVIDNQRNIYGLYEETETNEGESKKSIKLVKMNEMGNEIGTFNLISEKDELVKFATREIENRLSEVAEVVGYYPDAFDLKMENLKINSYLRPLKDSLFVLYEFILPPLEKDRKDNIIVTLFEKITIQESGLKRNMFAGSNIEFGPEKPLFVETDEEGNVFFRRESELIFITNNMEKLKKYSIPLETGLPFSMTSLCLKGDRAYLVLDDDIVVELEKESVLSGKGFNAERVFNPKNCRYGPDKIGIDEKSKKAEDKILYEILENVRSDLEDKMEGMEYLTILSSPNHIPLSSYVLSDIQGNNYRIPLDSVYSDFKINEIEDRESFDFMPELKIGADGIEDVAVGRIFGITVSDTSSYLNRIMSFERNGMMYFPNDELQTLETLNSITIFDAVNTGKSKTTSLIEPIKSLYDIKCFTSSNKQENCNYIKRGMLHPNEINSNIYLYTGTGKTNELIYAGISSENIPPLQSTIGISGTSQTNDYYSSYRDSLFGANIIRNGGSNFGSVSSTMGNKLGEIIFSNIMSGMDLGNSLKLAKEKSKTRDIILTNFVLFGDPVMKPALKKIIDLGVKDLDDNLCIKGICDMFALTGTSVPKRVFSDGIVVIDPGHGHGDLGTVAKLDGNVIFEKDVNLENSKMLKKALARKGIQSILTRHDDGFYQADQFDYKIGIANENPDAVFFISMHMDATPYSFSGGNDVVDECLEKTSCSINDEKFNECLISCGEEAGEKKARKCIQSEGYSVFYNEDADSLYYKGEDRKDVANEIFEKLFKLQSEEDFQNYKPHAGRLKAGPNEQYINKGGLGVLRKAKMPANLIEVAFLCNDYDMSLLSDTEKHSAIISTIASGIEEFLFGDNA